MRSTMRYVLLAQFFLGLPLVAGCGGESMKPSPADGTPPPTSQEEFFKKDQALQKEKAKAKPAAGATK